MANLNTTVNNIQLKSNMVSSTEAASAWETDAKYPSALAVKNAIANAAGAAVCDVNYALGSVIITNTNTNPGTTVGGTWELIDKEYKNDYRATYNFGGWAPATTNGATLELSSRGGFIWNGHSLSIQMVLVTPSAVELAKGAVLGTLSRPSCGIKDNGTFYQCPENGIALVTTSDATYTINYDFYYDGTITFRSIVSSSGTARTTLPKGAKIYIDVPIQVLTSDMLDGFCDKFYWKRTA